MRNCLIIAILLISSCTKNDNSNSESLKVPPILFFQINKNGSPLADSTFLSSIKLSYYQNNNKYYVPHFGLWAMANSGNNPYGILFANLKDGVNNPKKIFYIEYPNNFSVPDSFYVSYVSYLNPSINTDSLYTIDSVRFDEKIPGIDTVLSQRVYIFNK
jgi:hypothetical protein